MSHIVNDEALDELFREARSHNSWQDKPVSDVTLQALYDLLRWGPTSANCSPARFYFLKSMEAKKKLKPHLMGGNVEKTMTAPVCVIVAIDSRFYEHIPALFPHNPEMQAAFSENEPLAEETAMRNGSLQGAYLILAARALGLDCAPMSGFDAEGVNAAFFPEGRVKSNFLCALGYGDPAGLHPRGPRLSFDDACKIF